LSILAIFTGLFPIGDSIRQIEQFDLE